MLFIILLLRPEAIFPLLSNLTLSEINGEQATFTWNKHPQGLTCASLYHIVTSNCGQCPYVTTSNYVICNISSSLIDRECTLTLQSVVCGNIYGEINVFHVNLIEG